MKLDDSTRLLGPNFHRLQIYSNIWDELIEVTPTFGEILATIKVGEKCGHLTLLTDPCLRNVLTAQG